MAAQQSTCASDAGPDLPASGGFELPGPSARSRLPGILGDLVEATCVLEVTCRALEAAQEDPPESVKPYTVTLRQGIVLINKACDELDTALMPFLKDDEASAIEPDEEL